MTIHPFPNTHYDAIMKEQGIERNALKPFLQQSLNDLSAILMEIDFAVAGNESDAIAKAVSDIEGIARQIRADKILEYCDILNGIIGHDHKQIGPIQYQSRLDHVLQHMREAVFLYSENIEQDL